MLFSKWDSHSLYSSIRPKCCFIMYVCHEKYYSLIDECRCFYEIFSISFRFAFTNWVAVFDSYPLGSMYIYYLFYGILCQILFSILLFHYSFQFCDFFFCLKTGIEVKAVWFGWHVVSFKMAGYHTTAD